MRYKFIFLVLLSFLTIVPATQLISQFTKNRRPTITQDSSFLTRIPDNAFKIKGHRFRPAQDTTFYTSEYDANYQVRRIYYERPDTDWIETTVWNKLGPITKEVYNIHEYISWHEGDKFKLSYDTTYHFILNAVINGETKKFYLQEVRK